MHALGMKHFEHCKEYVVAYNYFVRIYTCKYYARVWTGFARISTGKVYFSNARFRTCNAIVYCCKSLF